MRSTQVLFANGHAVYDWSIRSGTSPNAQFVEDLDEFGVGSSSTSTGDSETGRRGFF